MRERKRKLSDCHQVHHVLNCRGRTIVCLHRRSIRENNWFKERKYKQQQEIKCGRAEERRIELKPKSGNTQETDGQSGNINGQAFQQQQGVNGSPEETNPCQKVWPEELAAYEPVRRIEDGVPIEIDLLNEMNHKVNQD